MHLLNEDLELTVGILSSVVLVELFVSSVLEENKLEILLRNSIQ